MRNNTSAAPSNTTKKKSLLKPSTFDSQNGRLPSSVISATARTTIPKIKKSSSISTTTNQIKKKSNIKNQGSNTLFLTFLLALFILFCLEISFGNYQISVDQQNAIPFHARIREIFHSKQTIAIIQSASITSQDEGDLEMTSDGRSDNNKIEKNVFRNNEIVKVADLKMASNSKIKIDPDKEPIRTILERAGVKVTPEIYAQLPSYSKIISVYGDKVKIHGLETCPAFRKEFEGKDRNLAVAGMFNTGTNLLTEILFNNCYIEGKVAAYGWQYHGIRIQVPWGKHSPAYFRLQHTAHRGATGVKHEPVLPAVMIKDPYTWMGSLCRHHYAALWYHSPKHCPNLVANQFDVYTQNGKIVPAIVKYTPQNITRHTSIAGLWNDWNNNYIHYPNSPAFPRLMIRFEDVLFRTKETVTKVCECAGGKLYNEDKFIYVANSAKGTQPAHKGAQGLLQAVLFYGNITNRVMGFTKDDLKYAAEVLDKELMEIFNYNIV